MVRNLILIRHGESVGNVARDAAEAAGVDVIPIDRRDPDVPLSDLGLRQAAALGSWLATLPDGERPTAIWSSPYRRAVQTAEAALDAAPAPIRLDERLRDRELGILDRLTSRGVLNRYPEEAERRRFLGKLYYRPPGGESWCDVALRLRSFLADLDQSADERVLVACHDAVILLVRYVLERLDETELMRIAGADALANCSVTWLDRVGGDWQVAAFNETAHLGELAAVAAAGEQRGSTS